MPKNGRYRKISPVFSSLTFCKYFVPQNRALRKILCKKESKQIRKQITNMVFRSENGGIHLPVLAARSMLYDGMRTAGVNNGIRHRAY